MRSMRNDLTKTAQAAREPGIVQIKVFKAPPGGPRGPGALTTLARSVKLYVYKNFCSGGEKRHPYPPTLLNWVIKN